MPRKEDFGFVFPFHYSPAKIYDDHPCGFIRLWSERQLLSNDLEQDIPGFIPLHKVLP